MKEKTSLRTAMSMTAFILSCITFLGIFLIPMIREVEAITLGWSVIIVLLLGLLTYLLFQLSVALVDGPKKKTH
jgi:hypothetical protein